MRRVLLLVVVLVMGFVGVVLYLTNAPIELDSPIVVTIDKGLSTGAIADRLDSAGVLRSRRVFAWWAKLRRIDRQLRPGRYQFEGAIDINDVLDILRQGLAVKVKVTIPEGWTVERTAGYLAAELQFDSAKFMALTHESDLLRQYDIPADQMEGYLLPDTYEFYWGVEPGDVIDALVKANEAVFVDSVTEQMAKLGWDRHQVLTLASMIEAETGIADERPMISGVFHNRLEKGMLLQCDPTVIYAMGGLDGRPLLRKDLTYDSPYNTYVYAGLPPGPICNPGRDAIVAAVFPYMTDALYFVADGSGGHTFSRTLAEHNSATARARRERRSK